MTYLWLDCNAWEVAVFMPDGLSIDGRQLKVLHYLRSHIKIEDDFYDFIHKMLSEGCSENEYKAFY